MSSPFDITMHKTLYNHWDVPISVQKWFGKCYKESIIFGSQKFHHDLFNKISTASNK